ncbi:hypothetical protein Ddye_008742 [Dipteronia dyeriana]|uniref:RNase H type-1 domain-containing protein n=1 Tax=Dipteronia dyeriana TaxID=168575 RepID=A0AAE0CLL4_9ROSI|nr:hypothetical protein Ddye_008742 [Dipteronia dyeriana]
MPRSLNSIVDSLAKASSAARGVMDSSSTEVHAILRVCQLVSSNQVLVGSNISIISDSKFAVSWIKCEDFGNLKLVQLVYDIRHLFEGFIEFKPWSSNSIVDSLAKASSAARGDGLEWGGLNCFAGACV